MDSNSSKFEVLHYRICGGNYMINDMTLNSIDLGVQVHNFLKSETQIDSDKEEIRYACLH